MSRFIWGDLSRDGDKKRLINSAVRRKPREAKLADVDESDPWKEDALTIVVPSIIARGTIVGTVALVIVRFAVMTMIVAMMAMSVARSKVAMAVVVTIVAVVATSMGFAMFVSAFTFVISGFRVAHSAENHEECQKKGGEMFHTFVSFLWKLGGCDYLSFDVLV